MPVIAEPFIPQHLQYPSGYYFGRPQSYGSHEALSSSPAPELVRQEELYSRQFEFGTAETRNQEGYFTADTMVGDPPELGPLESRATGGVSYAIDEMLEFDGDNVSSLQSVPPHRPQHIQALFSFIDLQLGHKPCIQQLFYYLM